MAHQNIKMVLMLGGNLLTGRFYFGIFGHRRIIFKLFDQHLLIRQLMLIASSSFEVRFGIYYHSLKYLHPYHTHVGNFYTFFIAIDDLAFS